MNLLEKFMSNHIRSKSEFFSFYFVHDKQIMYYKQIYNTYKSAKLKATKRKTRQAGQLKEPGGFKRGRFQPNEENLTVTV